MYVSTLTFNVRIGLDILTVSGTNKKRKYLRPDLYVFIAADRHLQQQLPAWE